jgi:hypothetical protein
MVAPKSNVSRSSFLSRTRNPRAAGSRASKPKTAALTSSPACRTQKIPKPRLMFASSKSRAVLSPAKSPSPQTNKRQSSASKRITGFTLFYHGATNPSLNTIKDPGQLDWQSSRLSNSALCRIPSNTRSSLRKTRYRVKREAFSEKLRPFGSLVQNMNETVANFGSMDKVPRLRFLSFPFGSTKLYLLPARHVGNGLGRGYFFTTDWIKIDRVTCDACRDARDYRPKPKA